MQELADLVRPFIIWYAIGYGIALVLIAPLLWKIYRLMWKALKDTEKDIKD